MAVPKPLTVAELLEHSKYVFPILTSTLTLTIIREVSLTHQPIPTFAELGALGIEAGHTIIGPSYESLPPNPLLTSH